MANTSFNKKNLKKNNINSCQSDFCCNTPGFFIVILQAFKKMKGTNRYLQKRIDQNNP